MKQVLLICLVLLLGIATHAQRSNMSSVDYNKDLVNPIMEDDVMFRKYVTRRINFKEKQNKGFANAYSHFSRELQNALKDPNSGIIPYSAGSIIENGEFKKDATAAFSQAAIDFVKKAAEQAASTPADAFDEKGNIKGGIPIPYGSWNTTNQLESEALNYLRTLGCDDKGNSQVTTRTEQEAEDAYLHMVEEVVFDKRRSRMYINIIAFQLVSSCEGGSLPQPGPFIKYQQVDKYFRKLYYDSKETKGMWFNEQNVRRKMCVMDAFELRLFSSRIIKISNAEDKKLEEIYTNKMEELYKSQEAEMELMEFEHNLWEF
jgi:gliding motility associated protien GldN